MKIIDYFLKNWLLLLILVIAIFMVINGDADIRALKKENKTLKADIKELEKTIENNNELIEALSIKDTEYIEKIKIVKQKADVQVIYVDTMSVSDKQDFFSKRYPE